MTQTDDLPRANSNVLFYVFGIIAAVMFVSLAVVAGLFLLGFLASLATSPTALKPTLSDRRPQSWKIFDGSEWGFEVDVPGNPTSQQRTTPNGRLLNVFFIRTDDGMFMIFASSTSPGGPPPKQLINELQAQAYTEGERFLYEEFVNVPKADACKELHFIDKFDELTMIRLVVTANAFYQVSWSGSPADRNSPAAKRFLNSFRIVN